MSRSLEEIAEQVMEMIDEHGWTDEGVPNYQDRDALNDFSLIAILSKMYPDPETAEIMMSN